MSTLPDEFTNAEGVAAIEEAAGEAADDWLAGRVESFDDGVKRVEKRRKKQGDRLQKKISPATWSLTDMGNAERLVHAHGHDLRFAGGRGWLVWNGQRWAPDLTGAVMRTAKATVRSIYAEAATVKDFESRMEIVEHARRSESAARLAAMIALAESEERVAISPDALDPDPMLLNVKNGTLDLRKGTLRAHRRDDLITKLAPVDFDPEAEAPTWTAFLERVFGGNAEVLSFVRRLIGYALTGSVDEHAIAFFYGSGANGKSTLINVLVSMLGDFAIQAAPDLLMSKREGLSAGDAAALAALAGIRIAVCTELDGDRSFDERLIKATTGGDLITAKLMRENWFTFAPTHKVVVAGNAKPRIKGTDHGIWRRMRLVPFDVTIADAERDPRLPEKLRAELPGILRHAVEGCLEWQRVGLGNPEAVRAATAEYQAESDPLGRFLRECCAPSPGIETPASTLYGALRAWAEDVGERAPSQTKLGKRLATDGYERSHCTRTGRTTWLGITLNETGRALIASPKG